MTHSEAYMMVRGKRGVMRRKVGNNTYAEILDDGSIGITLHSTIVVKIHTDGTYTLSNGGWQTPTTKDRINQYTPFRITQRNFEWYITVPTSHGTRNEYPFYSGMVIQS